MRVVATAAVGYEGTADAARLTGEFWARYFSAPELVDHAVALGLASADEIAAMAAAWRAWGVHPGAFWARFACEAVGWVE